MSCAYTIEHLGRRLTGVKDIYVDARASTIQLDYDPNDGREALKAIPEIVQRIGYNAVLRSSGEGTEEAT
jgi:hypothetical protein